MGSPETPKESAGQYSIDDDDQLPQEDTLIDRGVDDILDEDYSPRISGKNPETTRAWMNFSPKTSLIRLDSSKASSAASP
jgi:hypothetical protein